MFSDYFSPLQVWKPKWFLKLFNPQNWSLKKCQISLDSPHGKYPVLYHARCQCWDGLCHSRIGEEKQVGQVFIFLLLRKGRLQLRKGPLFLLVQCIPLSGHVSSGNGSCMPFLGSVASVRPVARSVLLSVVVSWKKIESKTARSLNSF